MSLEPGDLLQERYQVLSTLGQGGMGAVYRCRDARLDTVVAVKEMLVQPGLDEALVDELRAQFRAEARILARLRHPHLVQVSDFFAERGNAYLVMDFVEGENLAERIAREGAQPEARVLEWAGQLLAALAYCHAQGIIHRDVKPHNVILRADGQAVLVDFGLVKLWDPRDPRTRTVVRGMGTPEYAPPEQYGVRPGHTDARSDVYSLGATLYHTLTGQAPPTATDRMVDPTALRPVREVVPSISVATAGAVMRALEPQPPLRFQSAAEMAAALSRAPGTPADQVSTGEAVGESDRRSEAGVPAAASREPERPLVPGGHVGGPSPRTPRAAAQIDPRQVTVGAQREGPKKLRWQRVAVVVVALLLVGGGAGLVYRWISDRSDLAVFQAPRATPIPTRRPAPTHTPRPPDRTAAVDEAAPAEPVPPVKLALLAPIEGELAYLGDATRRGAALAVDTWNARGGVLDRPVELLVVDSQCNPDPAVDAFKRVVDREGVRFAIGDACSNASIALSEIAMSRGVLLVSPSSTGPMVTQNPEGHVRALVFRTCFVDPFQGWVAARFALEWLGLRRAAMLVVTEDPYSEGLAEAFASAYRELGGDLVLVERFGAEAGVPPDLSAVLPRLRELAPDLIYLPTYYTIVNQVAGQLREAGIEALLLGGDGWDSPELDRPPVEGGYFTAHFSPADPRPEVQAFVARYEEAYRRPPDALAALGYDAADLILAAMERAGTTDDPIAVARALESGAYLAVTGELAFDHNHNPVKHAVVYRVERDGFVYAETIAP